MLKVLDGKVPNDHRGSISDVGREEMFGRCTICRKLVQQDLGESVMLRLRRS
jgi:hypothetical protein